MKPRLAYLCLLLVICMSGLAQQSSAQTASGSPSVVPRLIRFAGQLNHASGTVGITFTLHKSQQDTAALWIETQNVRLDGSGKYTVLLGATKPEGIPTELFTSGEAQWLSIHVEGQPEQRVLLVSVPYALKAAEADTLAGHAATDFVTSSNLSSAVQQQVQAHFNTVDTHKNAIHGIVIDPATTFMDSNSSQIVSVIQSGTGQALVATAPSNTAITGNSTASSGSTIGVLGQSASTSGIGLRGFASATSGSTVGLFGSAASVSGTAIAATESATSGTTVGLQATVSSASGIAAIMQNKGSGKIVSARSGPSNTEVLYVDGSGNLTTSASVNAATTSHFAGASGTYGLTAVGGENDAATSGGGIKATGANTQYNTAGNGVDAFGGTVAGMPGIPGTGVAGTGGAGAGGEEGGIGGYFTGGDSDSGGTGVWGQGGSVGSYGLISLDGGEGGYFRGGDAPAQGTGGDGIYAQPGANGSTAGYFAGNITVTGTITAGVKDFRIDHPLDPENQFLVHASVESSEMMNIYSGNVHLNTAGEATVRMPSWFAALNADYRYLLTAIGAPAPNLFIKQELSNGEFVIAGGKPGQKITWTVTAVRHDAFANAHPLQVEEKKTGRERGRYQNPEAFGKPETQGISSAVAPHRGLKNASPAVAENK